LAKSRSWQDDPRRLAVIIPVLNAGPHLDAMIAALERQALSPESVLVIDSGSRDATVERFRAYGAEVTDLGGRSFNHGGTRRYGTELRLDADYYVMLTQDAIPADPHSIETLLQEFDDPEVGMAYGRQLPRASAGAIERHARLYNYPSSSEVRSYSDRARYGVRTTFCSDSFAAYRASALRAVGGFPKDCYFAEDQYVAGKMLIAGLKVAYCAEARVIHSHGYSLAEEFRRYFDIGVWHRRDAWLIEEFGRAEGEGLRFIKSELIYLLRNSPLDVPSALLRTLAKYLGYRFGLREAKFSSVQKQKLAMQSFYWAQQEALQKDT